ncbi:GNAT family N-acetyltransferase [Streptomyces sp. NBC_00887]|uniref:GNAT family N-acetyltransferase n=1 Tax=Streptomyces sp. NBC_00887 TaxID=2975859 RepID=UPI0038675EAA|nr:GNAT family N-acetyltransferase [Streptomyces sp. NBC_00887]
MTDRGEIAIVPWPGRGPSAEDGLSGLLAAYHLRTEEEKGAAVPDVGALPDRYRAEILDPRTAFANDVVLVALSGAEAVGCLVVTAPVEERCEVKRLWTAPSFRGRGVASELIGAALARCARDGVSTVGLSVWKWRTGAVALYERLGFAVTESWDERGDLVCMERAV